MNATVKVLFACVHDAGRSRMAEALLRELGGPRFEVTSAGFEPREANPLAVEALAQVGLALPSTGPQPSVFELFKAGRHFHYVIGACDEEHGQKCPLFPGVTQRIYWSFPASGRVHGHRTRRSWPESSRCATRSESGSKNGFRSCPATRPGRAPRSPQGNRDMTNELAALRIASLPQRRGAY